MKLSDAQLSIFIDNIKLKAENMKKYRDQLKNLKEKLEAKIKNDKNTGLRVTKYIISGSWKKRTILRPTGEHPIDIDLVLFVEGENSSDIKKLYDYIVTYLKDIYPLKDISNDVDAEGNTKSITIKFIGSGLEVDIVPVVPLESPLEYVWQPERGGGGKYITSISKQLSFALNRRQTNSNFTSIVRAIKWWKNFKELYPDDDEPGLNSYTIELIQSYLDINHGLSSTMEEGIIRFFQFISNKSFPEITFKEAINKKTNYNTILVADDTNNENNIAKKINNDKWQEIIEEANDAFDTLNIAQSKIHEGDTIQEWKHVFGPSFKIKN